METALQYARQSERLTWGLGPWFLPLRLKVFIYIFWHFLSSYNMLGLNLKTFFPSLCHFFPRLKLQECPEPGGLCGEPRRYPFSARVGSEWDPVDGRLALLGSNRVSVPLYDCNSVWITEGDMSGFYPPHPKAQVDWGGLWLGLGEGLLWGWTPYCVFPGILRSEGKIITSFWDSSTREFCHLVVAT